MLRFKNYLIENLRPIVLTIREITTKAGHVLPPGHRVKILRSPSKSFHTAEYEINGKTYTSNIRSDAVTLPGKLSPSAIPTQREKEIIAHTYRTLSSKDTPDFDTVPEEIRPHVTALHNEIKAATSNQPISKITLLKGSRVFASTIRDINQDRNSIGKSQIDSDDHHLIVGTDLVAHTHDGHSHYFDLKFPSKKYSYSLPSPGIGTLMNTINDIHPDYEGHGDYVKNMRNTNNSAEMAKLTAERINQMSPEQKSRLHSHLFQTSPQKGTGYTIHRIIYQSKKKKDNITRTIVGQDNSQAGVTAKSIGRNIHFSGSDGTIIGTIAMSRNKGGRAKIRPPGSI